MFVDALICHWICGRNTRVGRRQGSSRMTYELLAFIAIFFFTHLTAQFVNVTSCKLQIHSMLTSPNSSKWDANCFCPNALRKFTKLFQEIKKYNFEVGRIATNPLSFTCIWYECNVPSVKVEIMKWSYPLTYGMMEWFLVQVNDRRTMTFNATNTYTWTNLHQESKHKFPQISLFPW